MILNINEIGEKLTELFTKKAELTENYECFALFDKDRAEITKGEISKVEIEIFGLKADFDLIFSDAKAKVSGFSRDSDSLKGISYHKNTFDQNLAYYVALIEKTGIVGNMEKTCQAVLNKGIKAMGGCKKYAFKVAFYQVSGNYNGFLETLESFTKYKAKDKKRNELKQRDDQRKSKKTYYNAESPESDLAIAEDDLD